MEQMNKVLCSLRKHQAFNPQDMQSVFYGPPDYVSQLKSLFHDIGSNPTTQNSPAIYAMTREQQLAYTISKLGAFIDTYGDFIADASMLSIDATNAIANPIPSGVHNWMFVASVRNLASSEQRDEWMPEIKNKRMLGSYVQTEIGHGSNVRGLETTAEYNPATQEFTINSPTISSTKFWLGSLGTFANHGVVLAN